MIPHTVKENEVIKSCLDYSNKMCVAPISINSYDLSNERFSFIKSRSFLPDVTQKKANTHIYYSSRTNCIRNIIPISEGQFHDIPC